MQLGHAQIDDVPVQEYRHRDQLEKPHPQFRGHELQRRGHLVIDDPRQRQHVDQVQHGGPELPARGPAEADQQQPAHPQDHGIGHDVGDRRQISQQPQGKGGQHDQRPDPAPVGIAVVFRDCPELTQEQKRRQHGDQRAVAVFRQLPGLQERGHAVLEKDQGRDRGNDQPEHAPAGELFYLFTWGGCVLDKCHT